MRHIITVELENEAGALSRVAGLFSARGFNIESLTVAATHDVSLSRLTLVTIGDDSIIEQIVKQLNKLIDVVKVIDLTDQDHVERELMLVKVCVKKKDELEVKQLVDIFSCKIVDVSDRTYTIEIAGKTRKLNAFLNALDFAIVMEVSRTGVTGISRGRTVI
jgi:acetolactate synthase-1/3 small subunit